MIKTSPGMTTEKNIEATGKMLALDEVIGLIMNISLIRNERRKFSCSWIPTKNS